MPNKKEKPYIPHIKIYTRTEEEKKLIEEHAKEQGLSASSWLRSLALKAIKKGKGGK